MNLRSHVATNIRRLRRAAGLSQEALADAAGLDRTYISALERSRYAVTVDVLERLAIALRVDAAELLVCAPSTASKT